MMNKQSLKKFIKANGNASLTGRLIGISEGHARKLFQNMTVEKAKEILDSHSPSKSSLIIPLSDWHVGEVIEPTVLNGQNSYNSKVAKDRMNVLFNELRSFHDIWDSEIHFVMMGDHISGMLHEENTTEDEMSPMEANNFFTSIFANNLKAFLQEVASSELEIHIHGVTSNHARTTRRIRSKKALSYSYDMQLQKNLEMIFDNVSYPQVTIHNFDENIIVDISDSFWAFSHGHFSGIGTTSTAIKGKPVDTLNAMQLQWTNAGIVPDYCAIAHFHSFAQIENWFVFPAACGSNEYETFNLRVPSKKPRSIFFRLDDSEIVDQHLFLLE